MDQSRKRDRWIDDADNSQILSVYFPRTFPNKAANRMNQYMVEIDLPALMTQQFMSLVPSQRAMVNELMSEGRIDSYTLSLDRRRLWVIFIAETESEVNEALDGFPIMPYCSAEVSELMFHNTMTRELPVISLN
ncbi:MAG: muconolactone Delta-isomerase family protein [Bacteroidota bacterium]